MLLAGSGTLILRLDAGGSLTTRRERQILQRPAAAWPPGADWPAGVPRPRTAAGR